ncbi:MAG: efflux RND transporter periplasmic adaptor subunit [Magnetococcus sp. DMHC-6]
MNKFYWPIHLANRSLIFYLFFMLSLLPANAADERLSARVLLQAVQETILSSRIAGHILDIPVPEGGRFKEGETLILLDCAIQQAQGRKAQAELNAAKNSLAAQKSLEALGSGSTLEMQLGKNAVEKAQAEWDLQQATIQMCRIKAPFSGRVAQNLVHPFQSVSLGQPLLEILNDHLLETRLVVPSIWLKWLFHKTGGGFPFTFHLDETGKEYSAQVDKIGARIDPASQTLIITGKILGSHPELLPGMSGVAYFNPFGSKPP